LSLTDAKDLAAVLLGSAVESAEEVSASAEHRVFRITLRDLTAFLKIATKAHLEPELAALQLLGPTEVPVASVLATDLDGSQTGIPCALLRHVGGIPLSYDSPLFASSGPLLRQVHEVSVDGYGHLSANSGTPRGQEQTWADAIQLQIQGIEPVVAAGLVDANLAARAVAEVTSRMPLLHPPEPGRLIHGDFHFRHVFADDIRVTGVIDWGDASSGDPLYDFGRILHSIVVVAGYDEAVRVVDKIRRSYGQAPWLHAGSAQLMLVYAVAFILEAMKSEHAGGSPWPPWWPAQIRALHAILEALDGT